MTPLYFSDELRIVFRVRKYDQAREFYEQTLGLSVLNEWNRSDSDRGVVYALGRAQLEILKADTDPIAEGTYTYIEVTDVDALWESLAGKVEVIDPIATQEWRHRNFSIRDPNGFKLKFFTKLNS